MKRLIKHIQDEWAVAKKAAQTQCESKGDYTMACKLEECEMFKGDETLEELIDLMFTSKGIEFLTKYNFPDIATFRKFKKYNPERFGVYIDCGKISLTEVRRAFLVGNTTATANYRETAGNRLFLMCGATASITASGYSVVKVEKDASSKVDCSINDHAKVLW